MSQFCPVKVWLSAIYLVNAPSQLFWETEIRRAQRRNRKLKNGFEYMYFHDLQIQYLIFECMYFEYMYLWYHIFVFVLCIHISYFHGHGALPLHGKTHSAIDEQTETGSRKTPPTTHSNVRWRKKIRGKKWKPALQSMLRIVFTGVCGMVNNTTDLFIYWCAQ